MKIKSTIFPVKSSSEDLKTKQTLKVLKNQVSSDKTEKNGNNALNETAMLAKLLKTLREQHEIGLLAICKQISELKIDENTLFIGSDFDLSELETNAVYREKLQKFFSEFHLNMKLKEKEKADNSAEILSQMLDGKLTIK